ncbi:hypothetical protein JOF29_006370 [Kribbella aluminosa]|uniref:Uncharacterized protein n=1 Tax=Kribbella aluminosa TaxID=416017 RepID=A0ABS4UUG3_9ACTN|nr:hypothetical protein [Kribbella aluminosa]MBP2355260.1 hypothetical protein [Kribbella aluminosa]
MKTLTSNGAFYLDKTQYMVDGRRGFQHVLVITNGNKTGDTITITDLHGEILIEHTRPHPAPPTSATADHPDHTPTNPKRHRSPETSQSPKSSQIWPLRTSVLLSIHERSGDQPGCRPGGEFRSTGLSVRATRRILPRSAG